MAERDKDLFLGFDASCSDCSNIARMVRREAGDHIEVISLRSQQMQQWRRQALGSDAPWAPTLVRVKDGTVQAWTGWQIAPVLARHVDAKSAWHILAALGGNALSGRGKRPGIGRSQFLRGAVGSVIGLGVLMKAGTAAASTRGRAAAGADEQNVKLLTGDRLVHAARQGLDTPDLANVADARSLVGPKAKAPAAPGQLPVAALRESDGSTGEVAAPHGELEVYGAEIAHDDGLVETRVLYYQHEQRMLLLAKFANEPVDGIKTSVQRLHVEHVPGAERPNLSTVARSINGTVPKPVPETELGTLADDPCGGCNLSCGPGNPCGEKHLTEDCNWEATWQCVLGAGGCALCLGCSGWFTCIGCAITACPTAVDACCPTSDMVCTTCVYPT